MNTKLLSVAVAAAMAAPAAALAEIRSASREDIPMLSGAFSGRRGKGKGKRPHHPSRRFVAMDKRDARKARNRNR